LDDKKEASKVADKPVDFYQNLCVVYPTLPDAFDA
jgi:hypothetical protein